MTDDNTTPAPEAPPAAQPKKKRSAFFRAFRSIRANILVGIFLAIPVVVTILIVRFLFKFMTGWLSDDLKINLGPFESTLLFKFIVLVVVLLGLYFIGLLVRSFLGRRLYQFGDKLLSKIPVVRSIYVSVRQISESLFTQRKTLFKECVLIEYPRKGLQSLAFVTAELPEKFSAHVVNRKRHEPCVSLFIPTTPNPTSGVFIIVPRSQVTPLKIPVTDALTFIMSAGAVAPGEEGSVAPTLLDKLENWLRQDSAADTEEQSHAPGTESSPGPGA